MHTLRALATTLLGLALTAACGGPELDHAEYDEAPVTSPTTDRGARQFIDRYGLSGEACFVGKAAVQCLSGDRARPIQSTGPIPSGGVWLCAETSRGTLTGCTPQVSRYSCGFSSCQCTGYFDCWELARDQNCIVIVLPGSGPAEVLGSCVPGSAG
jgi:hypothetical protein